MKTKEEIELLKVDALSGDASAQNSLGCAYGTGDGVPKDYVEAFKWFSESANNGNKYGQYNVGLYYQKGFGIPKNMEKALRYYEQAANNSFGEAFSIIGKLYETGYSSPYPYSTDSEQYSNIACNPEEAFYWYKRGANRDENAKFNYARCLEEGIGTEIDLTRACEVYFSCSDDQAKIRLEHILTTNNPIAEPKITKLSVVYKNPFRILGVFGNAAEKEIRANVSKISAFSKIGKPIYFENDDLFPAVKEKWLSLYSAKEILSLFICINETDSIELHSRSAFYKDLYSKASQKDVTISDALQEDRQRADEILNGFTSGSRVVHSLFWFYNYTKTDTIALDAIKRNDWNSAINAWKDDSSFSAEINLSIICWILGLCRSAILHILRMLSDEDMTNAFLRQAGIASISKEDVSKMYWDILFSIPSSALPREDLYYMALGYFDKNNRYISEDDIDYCTNKVFNELKEKLSACWEEAKAVPKTDFDILQDKYSKLIKIATSELLKMKRQLGEDNYLYRRFNEDIALDVLETAIHINNNYEEWTAASIAHSLASFSLSIAINPILKERCQKNVDIFKSNNDHVQVDKAFKSIKNGLDKIESSSYDLADISNLNWDILTWLSVIQDHVGENITLYRQISDGVVNRLLNLVVKLCNSTGNEISLNKADALLEFLKNYYMTTETYQRLRKNIEIIKSNASLASMNSDDRPKRSDKPFDELLGRNQRSSLYSKEKTKTRREHKFGITMLSLWAFSGILYYLNWGYNWEYFLVYAPWWIYSCVGALVVIAIFIIDMWVLELKCDPFDWDFTFFDNAHERLSNFASEIEQAGAQGSKTYSWPFAFPFYLLGLIILIIGFPVKLIAKLATLIR